MATPSPSASSSGIPPQPPQYRAVGVALAIGSGVLIGSSFVFKKKGLLSSQKGHAAGEGVGYLKSPMWWTGMTIMILGELCNFAAYAFVEAIIVTPMGALSVVISSLLSHFILKEKLSTFGWISCVQCLLGASILAINGPEEQSVSTIIEFRKLFVTPWFLTYAGVVIVAALVLIFYVAPRWGHKSMMPYIAVCSLIGGLSVSCTQGLGACILTSIRGENQFKNWFIYFLLVFVVITLLTEIYYLNVALALYNTAMVTPTYYVTFTFCTLLTSVILYQGLKAAASQIITIVLAFAVICTGIFILQMSKVDPRDLTNVDERTTLLLEAARQEVNPVAARTVELQRGETLRSRRSRRSNIRLTPYQSPGVVSNSTPGSGGPIMSEVNPMDNIHSGDFVDAPEEDYDMDEELEKRAIVEKVEEPGLDSLRGFSGAIGSFIRHKKRERAMSQASQTRSRTSNLSLPSQDRRSSVSSHGSPGVPGHPGWSGGWLKGLWGTPRPSRLGNPGGDLEKSPVIEVEETEDPIDGLPTTMPRHSRTPSARISVDISNMGSVPPTTVVVPPTLRSTRSERTVRAPPSVPLQNAFGSTRSTSAPMVPTVASIRADIESQSQPEPEHKDIEKS